jgi:hypothetical protein
MLYKYLPYNKLTTFPALIVALKQNPTKEKEPKILQTSGNFKEA